MSSPAERIWTVDTYLVDEFGNYHEQPQALTTALLECVGMISRLGGVIQMATRRQEVNGLVVTVAVVFRWRSFTPVERAQEAPPAEQDGTAAQAQAPPLAQPPELAGVVDDVPPAPATPASTAPPVPEPTPEPTA